MKRRTPYGFALICFLTLVAPSLLSAQTPLATDPLVPITVGEKAKVFGYRIIAPSSLGKSAFMAAVDQWKDSPTEWGQGVAGYSRRFGHKIATRGVENGIGFAVASALHEDPRYFRLSQGTVGQRVLHALRTTILTRTDKGDEHLSIWRFTSNYGAQFVSNSWRPEQYTQVGETLQRGTVSIGYDAASNILKEFWPDIRRRVFRR